MRLLITAQDVIHAWWVPAVAMKKDAIPGYINEIWVQVDADKVGTYRGQCAELCGQDHGFMPIVVEVLSKDDYKAWIAQQKAAVAPPAEAAPAADVAPAGAAVAPVEAARPVASVATPAAARG